MALLLRCCMEFSVYGKSIRPSDSMSVSIIDLLLANSYECMLTVNYLPSYIV